MEKYLLLNFISFRSIRKGKKMHIFYSALLAILAASGVALIPGGIIFLLVMLYKIIKEN